ncbi:MAG TPA: SHOCT domain-containing protein [Jatrophihabitans sp.]|nr:SHOCT domain-containing protein [Jatrophihabitans sp.]
MPLAATDYPFLSVMWSTFVFFGWVLFIWLLITVYADLFRRNDISGWGKAAWIVFTIFLPFIGVFVYLIAQGRAMSARTEQRHAEARSQVDAYVRSVAQPTSSTDEIVQAKELLDTGAITPDEFTALKQKALTG